MSASVFHMCRGPLKEKCEKHCDRVAVFIKKDEINILI